MFDVSFGELVVIAVVALLVVGPDEFPVLVRKVSGWMGKARHFMQAVKTEFVREVDKAAELKQLIEKEVQVAELHKILDETKTALPVDYDARRAVNTNVPLGPGEGVPAVTSSAPEHKHEAAQ